MVARRTDSRSRMIETAFELFRCRGYNATAFSDVVEQSGAPRGSIYYHFPGGKRELALETIAMAGDQIEKMVDQASRKAHDPLSLIRALAQMQMQRLEKSGYCSGCAIATIVLELAPMDEEVSAESEKVFDRWRSALVERFEQWGVEHPRAGALADLVVTTFEGGLVVSRAARSSEPFWSTIDALIDLLDRDSEPSRAAKR